MSAISGSSHRFVFTLLFPEPLSVSRVLHASFFGGGSFCSAFWRTLSGGKPSLFARDANAGELPLSPRGHVNIIAGQFVSSNAMRFQAVDCAERIFRAGYVYMQRHRIKVMRVYAFAIRANMVKCKPSRDFTYVDRIRDTVRKAAHSKSVCAAISIAVHKEGPFNTRGFPRAVRKAKGQKCRMFGHDTTYRFAVGNSI